MYKAKVLRIAYLNYFCNFNHTDEEVLSIHAKFIEVVAKDSDVWWDDSNLDLLIPWEPFENYSPDYILDAIEALYENIVNLTPVIDLATELAEHATYETLTEGYCDVSAEVKEAMFSAKHLYSEDNGDIHYQSEAQDVFDEYHDYYETVLSKILEI